MKKKRDKTTIALFVILFAGLSLLLYPSVSDYWNSFNQSRAIATYSEEVAQIDDKQYEELWKSAVRYNSNLPQTNERYVLTAEQRMIYESLLNLGKNGIMGYVEIPPIKVSLPIYHGTDEAVLQIAIGHLEWTSLPTGGESTHCVISGHRGLPSAKLFSNLDQLKEGDVFYLRVLDETLTYEVDQILIVEPEDVKALRIEEGKDLCTLVTCTPYGINSHRLLVRGHRIETNKVINVRVSADAVQIDPMVIIPIITIPLVLMMFAVFLISDSMRKRKR